MIWYIIPNIYSYKGKCNLCGCNAVLYTYTDYVEGAPWESVSMYNS